jgi:hypothetical protein
MAYESGWWRSRSPHSSARLFSTNVWIGAKVYRSRGRVPPKPRYQFPKESIKVPATRSAMLAAVFTARATAAPDHRVNVRVSGARARVGGYRCCEYGGSSMMSLARDEELSWAVAAGLFDARLVMV